MALKADGGTKAGILRIYQHTGQFRSVEDLRDLTEQEQDWFRLGFEHYLDDQNHVVRILHSPRHFGKTIFYLSLIYFVTLITWMSLLIKYTTSHSHSIDWSMVWNWVVLAAVLNLCLTFYGIYLEMRSLRQQITASQRIVAAVAIIALIVAILGNVLSPLSSSASTLAPFIK